MAADGISETVYTYNGTETWITDPMGRTMVYDYFSDTGPGGGQLEKVRDAATNETVYTYDAAGNLLTTSGPVSGSRTWTYNAQGRLVTETTRRPAPRRTDGTSVGTLATVVTPNNDPPTFAYDSAHRLVGRDAPGTAHDLSISYDALGRVSQRTFGGVATTTTYDTEGRPVTRQDTVDGVTFASQYTYDPLDRLTALRYPSLHTAGYEYDAGGRLTAVTWLGQPFATLLYDDVETGRLTKYVTGPVTHEVTQDVRDRVQRLTVESPAAPDALEFELHV